MAESWEYQTLLLFLVGDRRLWEIVDVTQLGVEGAVMNTL